MPTVGLSHLTWAGLGKETTEGTAVAPSLFVPVTAFKPEDVPNYVRDESLAASASLLRGYYQAEFDSTVDLEAWAYPEIVGTLLVAAGFKDTAAGSAPTTHTFKLDPTQVQPPSFTITDYNLASYRQYPGCRIDSLVFNIDGKGAVKITSKWMGWKSATGSTATPTFPTNPPFLGWQTLLSVGGSARATLISSQLTIKRNTEAIHTLRNSQSPFTVFAGPVEADWTTKVVFQDETDWNHLLTNDQPSLSLVLTEPGSGAQVLTLQSTTAAWHKAPLDRSGKFMQLDAQLTGLYSATDAGPVSFVLSDTHSAAY